jgi:hypothetical protein
MGFGDFFTTDFSDGTDKIPICERGFARGSSKAKGDAEEKLNAKARET